MTKSNIVIVGSGQAGFQAAVSLRQEGFAGRITILGAEPGLPYQRPPLSKSYLLEGNVERLLFRNADFFEKNAIELHQNSRVVRIHCERTCVELESGQEFFYTHLILALGTKNRELPIAGVELGNVLNLRALADAKAIRQTVQTATKVLLIGGGFVGLELASALRGMKLDVQIVEMAPRVMERIVSRPVSSHFEKLHMEMGTDVLFGLSVVELGDDGAGNVKNAVLSDGRRLACDFVVVCAGVTPDIDIASKAGLETSGGISVSETLLTSDPQISAIGDCVSFVHKKSGQRVRLESVQNAVDQAKCVASNIAGKYQTYDRVAWFWSDQAGAKLQIAGLTNQANQWHMRQEEVEKKLTIFAFVDKEFVGTETVNNARDHLTTRKILALDCTVSFSDFENSNFNLQQILAEKSRTV